MCYLVFMQVSVLTDQVEAQGEKIRDLDLCLDEHREKLNATEEMLQQVCVCLSYTLRTGRLFPNQSPPVVKVANGHMVQMCLGGADSQLEELSSRPPVK